MIKKKFFNDFSIKNKIFFVSFVLLLIFSLIGIITFNYFSNLYEKRIYEEAAEVLQITSTILDEEINKVEKWSFQLATDDFIQRDFIAIDQDKYNYDMFQIKVSLMNRLEALVNSEQYISSIHIEDENSITYTSGNRTKIYADISETDMALIKQADGANVWLNLGEGPYLTAARLIRVKENLDLSILGTLFITIDLYRLIDASLQFSPHKNFVIQLENQTIYSHDENMVFDQLIDGPNESGYSIVEINDADYLVAYRQSRHSELTYYNILPFEEISEQTQFYKVFMIFVFLLMLLLTMSLSYQAAKGISEPLGRLTKQIKQAQHGSYEVEEEHSHDEIEHLSKNFHAMLKRIDELNRHNYEKQIIIKETEYQALQAQMNPHFLYNTLDSINWLAQLNDQHDIANMTEALGNMMRNIISKKDPLISIKKELDIVHNYITIQKHRYHDRLQFSLDDNITFYENIIIPKLSIQPVVENAIQHALEELSKPCKIHITMHHTKEKLTIIVTDNGPGMSKETIQAIYRNEIKKKSSGIGLYNILERIKLIYGAAYGLTIESEVGKGTKVKITLPFKRRGREDHV